MKASNRLNIPSGTRFGEWIVIEEAEPIGSGVRIQRRMICKCTCGIQKIVSLCSLRTGRSQRCKKCKYSLRPKNPKKSFHNRTYRIYWGMRERCYHSKCRAYIHYGGRGIVVCDRWMQNYDNFVTDMGEAPIGKSIDRIDNDGPYSPENCRWASPSEQANNRRSNRIVTFDDREMTFAQVAYEAGVSYKKLHDRTTYRGQSLASAISQTKSHT